MRIRNFNASYPHKDKEIIENMVSKETNSTTASRLENILNQKWFEKPTNYKIMTSLEGRKLDRVLDLIGKRKAAP